MAEHVNAPPSLANLRWNWQHILSYDPRPALEALRCPVLALYGSRDTTVPPGVHLARMRDALGHSGSRDATIRELPGANHHFYAAHTGGPSEVSTLQGFVDGYFDARVEWLRGRVEPAPTLVENSVGSPLGLTRGRVRGGVNRAAPRTLGLGPSASDGGRAVRPSAESGPAGPRRVSLVTNP